MWTIISNVSSIVTCVAFLLYLAGHIWVVLKNKHTIYEKFTVIPYDSKINIEEEDNTLIVDDNGCEFVLESEYGISNINIYKVDYDINSDGTLKLISRKQKSSFSNLKEEKLFIRCDLGEFIPTTQFGKWFVKGVFSTIYHPISKSQINIPKYRSILHRSQT